MTLPRNQTKKSGRRPQIRKGKERFIRAWELPRDLLCLFAYVHRCFDLSAAPNPRASIGTSVSPTHRDNKMTVSSREHKALAAVLLSAVTPELPHPNAAVRTVIAKSAILLMLCQTEFNDDEPVGSKLTFALVYPVEP